MPPSNSNKEGMREGKRGKAFSQAIMHETSRDYQHF
jgi:hypothetical protein